MSQKVITLDMLKKFGEVIENNGSSKGNKDNVIELCRLSLEKGYIYEVDTVISQSVANNNAINSYIYGNNCTVHYFKAIGIGVSGGGVTNRAIVTVDSDNATVVCSTYVYDNSITYNGYIRARKIAII